MYGNIGVPERLAFTAIGPTVIEVARIEKLTKSIGSRVARHPPDRLARPAALEVRSASMRSRASGEPQELFGFKEEAARQAA